MSITVDLHWGAATDTGNRRKHNEDAYVTAPPVFAVADGMGGHSRGEVAATIVVDSLGDLREKAHLTHNEILTQLAQASEQIEKLEADGPVPGSTLAGAALSVQNNQASWLLFNIGDSRIYLFGESGLQQISTDHSRLQELLDSGTVSSSQAHAMVGANVITYAIGGGIAGPPVPDVWTMPLVPDTRLLLCTDGLTGEVSIPLITALLRGNQDPQDAADALVAAALRAGGRDNVTVVVVDIHAQDSVKEG